MSLKALISCFLSFISSRPRPRKVSYITLMFIVFHGSLYAQDIRSTSPVKISGYLEAYYSYDFGNPQDHNRPGFMYAFNRHHEVNLNIGYIQASYLTEKVRANFALMTGTYANANLAAEPGVLKNIYEASIGVKISKHHNLWVDAGIFPSHIGFESAVGAVCWNMTRSILADNSPYFESGAKVSYATADGRWFVSGLILNGWQRIQRIDGNNTPAFGHQLTFKPSDQVTLNSSSFIGSDTPDSLRKMRYFHNFYSQFDITDKLGLIAGFDIGAQQQTKESRSYHVWYSPVLIARYMASDKLTLAARTEYYSDPSEVIVSTRTPNGFKTFGCSFNVDYAVADNVLWRIEARGFRSGDDIFEKDAIPSTGNVFLGTALSVAF